MMSKTKLTPPEIIEAEMLKSFPDLDNFTAHMLNAKEENPWPDWCYLPMAASYAIVTKGADEKFAQRYMVNLGYGSFLKLSAIIPWRKSKRIYTFDEGLMERIQDEPTDITAENLHAIPCPCVYIERPAPYIDDCEGVFFFLEWDYRYPEATEIRAHYLFSDGMVKSIYDQLTPNHTKLAIDIMRNNARTAKNVDVGEGTPLDMKRFKSCRDAFPKYTQLLGYLCSGKAHIEHMGEEPRQRRRGQLMVASHIDRIHVSGGYLRLNSSSN